MSIPKETMLKLRAICDEAEALDRNGKLDRATYAELSARFRALVPGRPDLIHALFEFAPISPKR